MSYRVELVWNREFDWVVYGKELKDLNEAKTYAKTVLYMGDGACVKKVRLRNMLTDEIIQV